MEQQTSLSPLTHLRIYFIILSSMTLQEMVLWVTPQSMGVNTISSPSQTIQMETAMMIQMGTMMMEVTTEMIQIKRIPDLHL